MTGSSGNGGFVTRSLETVHDWGYSRLVRRTVAAPGGDQFSRTYVDSPGAVGVVALTAGNQIVLVNQYRAPVDGYVLEIPAGMRDVDDEPALETARRELEEEVGYVAGEWVELGSVLSTPGVSNGVVELFLATQLEHRGSTPHGPEEQAMEVLHVGSAEAVAMCMDGRITDSKSVAGILRAARLFGF